MAVRRMLLLRCFSADKAAQFFEQRWSPFAFGHRHVDETVDLRGEAGVGGQHEDWNVGLDAAHAARDFAAVHPWHGEVEDDGLDGLAGEDFESGCSVERGEDSVARSFEKHPPDFETNGLVIDA